MGGGWVCGAGQGHRDSYCPQFWLELPRNPAAPTGVMACACSQQDRGRCCDSSLREKRLVLSSPTYCSLHLTSDSKHHPYYSGTGRKAAVGLPPALCFSGRGQQQEIKNCFSVAPEPCGLNEPTNPAAPRPRCLAPEQ